MTGTTNARTQFDSREPDSCRASSFSAICPAGGSRSLAGRARCGAAEGVAIAAGHRPVRRAVWASVRGFAADFGIGSMSRGIRVSSQDFASCAQQNGVPALLNENKTGTWRRWRRAL
ncbi:hypothetical protein [Methylobacterium mesophilicum]|uniref:hypothetical protein n=1 Tax=Methylobacterium mesophilicum TaxID=39956 RepID=UPI002F355BA9